MGRYAYDDFRLTFDRRPGSDDVYTVHAFIHGSDRVGTFTLPMAADELERAILGAAKGRSVRAGRAARDLGESAPVVSDAEVLGGALAHALFAGEIGAGYETALGAIERQPDRGLRLTLSLGATPELLSLPWEFLFRRPTFLAVQPHLPLVRHLGLGRPAAPRPIGDVVRILGVIANPTDLAPLDVDAERRRMEQAVRQIVGLGRVKLHWLPTATPRSFRKALQDEPYHIVHYVGHSDFVNRPDGSGEGVLFLEHPDHGRAVPVDSTMLANLLSDQSQLQLVVLNSCEGARTTLTDPYAGVATTLIQLGVPAVVAMQFEISDEAAIVFAEELYTNLIGRQVPIDAAVADARRAIYVEVNQIEWATPVLFLRDPETELFSFATSPIILPPPARPLTPPQPQGDEAIDRPSSGGDRRRRWKVGAGVVTLAALVGAGALLLRDGEEGPPTSATPATRAENAPVTNPGPANETVPGAGSTTGLPTVSALPPLPPPPGLGAGTYAVAITEADGGAHIFEVDVASGATEIMAARPGVTDSQPIWDVNGDRVAFTRQPETALPGTKVLYLRRDDPDGAWKKVDVVPWSGGRHDHSPAWSADGSLLFASTDGCPPAPGCQSSLQRISFVDDADGSGHLDVVADGPTVIAEELSGVIGVAAQPADPARVAVLDDAGIELLDGADVSVAQGSGGVDAAAYTPDGTWLVAATSATDQGRITVWPTGRTAPSGSDSLTNLLRNYLEAAPTETRALVEGALRGGLPPVRSMAPGNGDGRVIVLVGGGGSGRPPLVLEVWVGGGRVEVIDASDLPSGVTELGGPTSLSFAG